ncbi:MAG: diguanylate cyclase [Acidobacteriota bacterium]
MEQLNLNPQLKPSLRTPSAKWRVLVVDDEVGMGESLRLLLSRLGYEVSVANDGAQALEEIRSRTYDLVITDLVMDRISGYDIIDFVKQEGLPLPVIVLTGLGSVDAAVRALKQGAYDYILKPFEFDSFKVSIRRAVEKRHLELIQRIQNQRIAAVSSIAKAVSSTLRLGEIFEIIVRQSREFVEFDNAALILLNKEQPFVDLAAVVVDGQISPEKAGRIPVDHAFISRLLTQGSSTLISDLPRDPELSESGLPLLQGLRSFAAMQLVARDRLVGLLFFGSRIPFEYSSQDIEFLAPVADQIAVAVDHARLLELELQRSRQLEIINDIGKQLSSALVVERLLERAISLLKQFFDYQHIDVFYFNEDQTRLCRVQAGDRPTEAPRPDQLLPSEGVIGRAARSGQTILLKNVTQDPEYVSVFEDSTSELAIPLKSNEGVLGVLNIEEVAPRVLGTDDQVVMEALASQISLAWRNARLFDQIRKSKVYLELVLNAAEDTSIISIDIEGRVITFNSGASKLLGINPSDAIGKDIGALIQNRQARSVLKALRRKVKRPGWQGEIRIARADSSYFWAHIIVRPIEPAADLFVGFLIIMTDVTQRVELQNKLKQMTVTDDLTGLYNQRYFLDQLRREMERANRRHSRFSLCIFDLDKFKTYNDTYGHLQGDRLLGAVGNLVSNAIRVRIDTAFRYGGDEFVLILPYTSVEQAASLVDRLRASIRRQFQNQVSISAGLAEYREGMDETEFIETADRLMYQAKREGGDKVVFGVDARAPGDLSR